MQLTGNFDLLSSFDRAQDLVYGARNGTQLHIRILNVRYAPELGSESPTIVSVQQLASNGHLVMFCGGWCYVKAGHSDGSLVGKGRMHDDDGLYHHLEYLHIPDNNAVEEDH
ncbi:hypothetical protein E2562_024311 [Oryza meyeriana var. granulata]|uniref:Uncharacterized protein n=1 Tax=Oryza meyeriana var. granulata TaxID=110450 RepID=A0A6G1C8A7_9ORYZ|nr:hypothetical protein E2562_024311 [Oryza meyeriana var. granulata]